MDLLNRLNDKQYEAVTTTEGPVLMLAGAGSGKTHCLVCRVAYLIKNGICPENILLLTFTNKAAREMIDRAEKLVPGQADKVTACTYHAFCAKMLRQYGEEIEIRPDFLIIDSGDASDIIGMMKTELKIDKLRGLPKNQTIVNIISSAINKDQSIDAIVKQEYPKYITKAPYIQELFRAFQSYKESNHMMDYDDLLVKFRNAMHVHPEIAQKISDVYQYIMVDEYQDTNILQENILMLLRRDNHNLAVVGDDSQSLYGFRGADVYNIIHFPDKFNDCKVIPLMQNYRSTQEILDVANDAIDKNATEGYKKKLRSNHKYGAKPYLVRSKNSEEEARWIYKKILDEREKGVPPEEICVLARNSSHMYILETILAKAGLPYEKFGGQKFLEKAHIKDILAYLRLITNPNDEISWFRVLQLYIGIGAAYARSISRSCNRLGYCGLTDNNCQSRIFYPRLEKLKKFFESISGQDFCDFLPIVIEHYLAVRKETAENMKTDESVREELFELIEVIEKDMLMFSYMAKSYDNCIDFLDSVCLDTNPSMDKGNDKIILSTIHSAKGLEFSTVFIMDCVEGIFPNTSIYDRGTKEDNEELRCFYVAVTRAKTHLYLLAPKVAVRWGRVIRGVPSHYIDLKEDLYQIL